MQGMIERVATMIQSLHGEPGQTWQYFSDDAYAVVRDMHEPTAAMIAAAESKTGAEAWKAMIDVALTEHTDLDTVEATPDAMLKKSDHFSAFDEPFGATGL